jgi:Methyltransferase domain
MLPPIRIAKEYAKQSLHSLFALGQHLGVDILPRHFYSEIPDFRELRKSETWKAPRSMYGVLGVDVDQQLSFVQDCVTDQMRDILLEKDIYESACLDNEARGFGPIEAEFLFCFIVRHRPQRIIQVGAGVSTAVLLHAARTLDYQPAITCIDPYPTHYLERSSEKGQINLISKRAQDVDLQLFLDIGAGDLLFVDSTHTVKPGSEVNLLTLEVLPRLQFGSHVHFHDIYFPYDYPNSLMTTTFFPNESVFLHAFLVGNARYSVTASLSMLHHAKPRDLQVLLPHYKPETMDHGLQTRPGSGHFPSSLYLKVVG